MRVVYFLVALGMAARPLASQTTCDSACNQFISSVNAALNTLTSGLTASSPVIFSGNLVFANGEVVGKAQQSVLLSYVDGLKAAGAQRIDLNPAVTSVNNPGIAANYAAVVQHARQLGMQVSINPEVNPGELGRSPAFQQFEAAAMSTYVQLAQLYQPDNFVIVHEPTTAEGALGLPPGQQDWASFIQAVAPLIKVVSPHTRLGAGGFQNGATPNLSAAENAYWQQFVAIPTCTPSNISAGCLDFMTMDIYNDDTFPVYENWIALAKQSQKGIYIEETWAPHYLPIVPLPSSDYSALGNLTKPLDSLSLIGACDAVFADMDVAWLNGMAKWASANGMEAVTAFTTLGFFALESGANAYLFSPAEASSVITALGNGQFSSITVPSFQMPARQMGVPLATSVSSASYARLASAFCSGGTPCNPNSSVAPDELVSVFGTDLATSNASSPTVNFPISLAGTTATLVDSSNASFAVQLSSVSPQQINYLVPSAAQSGPATLTVRSGDGAVSTGIVYVQTVMPGLYTATADGLGAPAAIAVCAGGCAGWPAPPVNGQYFQPVFACSPACAPQPISVAAGDTVVLELYGTGIRHRAATSAISAQINGQTLPVGYAGTQGQYTGLDQVNVQLSPSLAGSTPVNLVLTVQDSANNTTLTTNPVTLLIQ